MDDLTQLSITEDNNRLRSGERLGDTVSLVQDFSNAHAKLVDLLGSTTPPNPKLLTVTAHLLMAVRYQLVTGALAILRGHLTDGMQVLRRAVELGAAAYRLHTAPELQDPWTTAETDAASWKTYRQEFKTFKLFPKEHELLQRLYERYRHCSGALHTSLASLARRATFEKQGTRIKLTQDYFEVTEEDPSEPARAFLFTLDMHSLILHLFTEVFAVQIEPVRAQWEVRMTTLDAKLRGHVEHWRPTLEAKHAAKGPAGAAT